MRICHFWAQNSPFAPNKIFLEKKQYYFHLPIGPFPSANLKKKSMRIQSYRDVLFFGPNGPFVQTRIFSENPLINLVPFIHAYLHSKHQSQISIYQ